MSAGEVVEASLGHEHLILWARWGGAAGGWLLRHSAMPGPLAALYKAPPCWHPPEPKLPLPTDEEAIITDRLVSALPAHQRHAVVARYLFRQRPDPRVLKAVGVSRAAWYRILSRAKLIVGVEKRRKELYG